jgi:acyl-CoA thioester hydrolase
MRQYITHYRPIYADTDAMGIVYHANYLRFFEMGRTEFLREIGFPYKRLDSDEGVMLPLADVSIKYKKPALYDELLEIRTTIAELKNASVTMAYEIYNEKGELLTTGKTRHAVTDENIKPIVLKKHAPELYQLLLEVMEKE